jgi:hypothetical protein
VSYSPTELAEFVASWGFCPHKENTLCDDCEKDPSQRSHSWADLELLTHQTQVAIFGWCDCEQGEPQFHDCEVLRS